MTDFVVTKRHTLEELHQLAKDDPCIPAGYRLVYDRNVPMDFCSDIGMGDTVETLEAIRVRIYLLSVHEQHLQTVYVELTSEVDLFFHWRCELNESTYARLQAQQNVMVEFSSFPGVLIRMLNKCIQDPNSFLAVLVGEGDSVCRVDFLNHGDYKIIVLLALSFSASSDQLVKASISTRYNILKTRTKIVEDNLLHVEYLLKSLNPSFLLSLRRLPATRGSRSDASAKEGIDQPILVSATHSATQAPSEDPDDITAGADRPPLPASTESGSAQPPAAYPPRSKDSAGVEA